MCIYPKQGSNRDLVLKIGTLFLTGHGILWRKALKYGVCRENVDIRAPGMKFWSIWAQFTLLKNIVKISRYIASHWNIIKISCVSKKNNIAQGCSEHETCFNCPIIHFTASQVKMNSKSSISPTKCISSGCWEGLPPVSQSMCISKKRRSLNVSTILYDLHMYLGWLSFVVHPKPTTYIYL